MSSPKEVPGELSEVAQWHEEQAAWHRHSAEFDAADKIEPTRSMLLDGAAKHEKFAASIRAAIKADRELRAAGAEPASQVAVGKVMAPYIAALYRDMPALPVGAALYASPAVADKVLPSDDTKRLNWLELQVVEVRTPLRYGSRKNFIASPADVEGELPSASDLRSAIDAALTTPSTPAPDATLQLNTGAVIDARDPWKFP